MTKRELRQLYNLKREIAQDYKRLEDLKDLALRCTSGIDGQPHGAGSGDRMSNVIADITDLEAEITEQSWRMHMSMTDLTHTWTR